MKKTAKILLVLLILSMALLSFAACDEGGGRVEGVSLNCYHEYDFSYSGLEVTVNAYNDNDLHEVESFKYRVYVVRDGSVIYSEIKTGGYIAPGGHAVYEIQLMESQIGTDLSSVAVRVAPVSMELVNEEYEYDSGSSDNGYDDDYNSGYVDDEDDFEINGFGWLMMAVCIIAIGICIVLIIVCGANDEEEYGVPLNIVLSIAAVAMACVVFAGIGIPSLFETYGFYVVLMLAGFGLGLGANAVGMGAIEGWIVVVGSIGSGLAILSMLMMAIPGAGVAVYVFGVPALIFACIDLYIVIRGEDHFL